MTRLSIQTRNEIDGISIHLRPGQSCTVGSSAVADFTLNDRNLKPVHCRLSCRASGGYIECVDPEDQIVVNRKSKNRSRLSHGDQLQVGAVALDVEMPEQSLSQAEFQIDFNDEPSPSTVSELEFFSVAEATENLPEQFSDIGTESVADENPPANDEEPEFEIANSGSNPRPTFQFEPLDQEDQETHQPDGEDSQSHDASRVLDPVFDQDGPEPGESDKPTFAEEPPAIGPPSQQAPPISVPNPESSVQPVEPAPFTFDSNDPDEVELTEQELKSIYDDREVQPDSDESFPTMNVSFAEAIDSDSESISVSTLDDVDLSSLDHTGADGGDGIRLPGGHNAGKFWRWQGREVQPTVDQLLDLNGELSLFQCSGMSVKPVLPEWARQARYLDEPAVILLLTKLPIHELQNQIQVHRWHDRMEHPRALRMFLEYAPQSLLEKFFEVAPAALLVEDGEPNLLRKNPRL